MIQRLDFIAKDLQIKPNLIQFFRYQFYSILEPRQTEDLVDIECVCSDSHQKEEPMDIRTSSLNLKIIGKIKTTLTIAVFLAVTVPINLSYIHTRDSSRADILIPLLFSV